MVVFFIFILSHFVMTAIEFVKVEWKVNSNLYSWGLMMTIQLIEPIITFFILISLKLIIMFNFIFIFTNTEDVNSDVGGSSNSSSSSSCFCCFDKGKSLKIMMITWLIAKNVELKHSLSCFSFRLKVLSNC